MKNRVPEDPAITAAKKLLAERRYASIPVGTPEERAALKRSIEKHGVPLTAVLLDADGVPLNGKDRMEIYKELGIKKFPKIWVGNVSEHQKREMAYDVQYCHKKRTRKELQLQIDAELIRDARRTDRMIADLLHCSHPSVAARRKRLIRIGKITTSKVVYGKGDKVYKREKPTVVVTTNTREDNRAKQALDKLRDKAPEGTVSVKALEKKGRQEERCQQVARAKANGEKLPDEERYKLYHCPMQELLSRGYVKPGSCPLILTDPLYEEEHLQDWSDLADFAAEVLMENGLLVAYCGNWFLDRYLERLKTRLNYRWTGCVLFPNGRHEASTVTRIARGFRPVLIFVKGSYKPLHANHPKRARFFTDTVTGGGKEKEWHPYQQDLQGFLHWARLLSFAGDLIIDPFGGSFTTAVAVKALGEGRRFVGCDIVAKNVAVGKNCLADVKYGSFWRNRDPVAVQDEEADQDHEQRKDKLKEIRAGVLPLGRDRARKDSVAEERTEAS